MSGGCPRTATSVGVELLRVNVQAHFPDSGGDAVVFERLVSGGPGTAKRLADFAASSATAPATGDGLSATAAGLFGADLGALVSGLTPDERAQLIEILKGT